MGYYDNNVVKKLKEKINKHFGEVKKTKTSPHSIALGFAIGTLIAVLPTPGFSILLGILIVLIFKKVNKFSLFIAMAVFNPLVLIPIYLLSYKIGQVLFGSVPVMPYNLVILNQVYHFTRRFLVGNLILAVFFSSASYFVVRWLVFLNRRKKIIKNKGV